MTRRGGARHVVLVGLMGSGKTTVGRRLAERLGRPFVDNDALLVARTGRSAREIADAHGADALHHEEAASLLDALGGTDPAVIAAAAAAVLEPGVGARLRGHDVVYLRAAPDVLAGRVARPADGHRPFVDLDARAVLTAQFAARDPQYLALATVTVDAGHGGPADVVDAISAALAP